MARSSDAPEPFRVEVSHLEDDVRLVLVGELDLATAPVLERHLSAAEESRARRIVLDLSSLTFLDSTGLKSILYAHRRAEAGRWELVLVPGPPPVQRVFDLAGVEDRLDFE